MPGLPNNSSIARFFPATLIPDTPLSDERLETFASGSWDLEHMRCERTEKGTLRIYAPTPEVIWLMISKFHSELLRWLGRKQYAGHTVVRRRFFLGDGSVLCPDIAYMRDGAKKRVDTDVLQPLQLCPNFIAEFCSHPRELRKVKDKMLRWMASGVELGWLMLPQERCVHVYSPGSEPETLDEEFAGGEGWVADFARILPEIWSLDECRRSY